VATNTAGRSEEKLMAGEPPKLHRFAVTALILLLGGVVACKGGKGQSVQDQAQVCFSKLNRPSAGRLRLTGPLDCDETVPRYRTQGPPDRPGEVVYLDGDGRVRMTYRVKYDSVGRPSSEERVMRLEAGDIKVYSRGDRMDFVRPLGAELKMVRIRTKLDRVGHAVEVAKYAGADLAYRMVRSYREGELKSEATYDGGGNLKFRSEFLVKDGRRVERMLDGKGKLLMERELMPVDRRSHSAVKGGRLVEMR